MLVDQERLPCFVNIGLLQQSDDDLAMVPVVTFETFVVMSRDVITSLLPLVEKVSTEAAAPSGASSLCFDVFGNGLCVRAILAAVRISMVGLEKRFGVEDNVTIGARILHLLFVITLLVDLPIVLPCEAFVARCAEVLLLGFEFRLALARRWTGSGRAREVSLGGIFRRRRAVQSDRGLLASQRELRHAGLLRDRRDGYGEVDVVVGTWFRELAICGIGRRYRHAVAGRGEDARSAG